jgi:hypothetical protein
MYINCAFIGVNLTVVSSLIYIACPILNYVGVSVRTKIEVLKIPSPARVAYNISSSQPSARLMLNTSHAAHHPYVIYDNDVITEIVRVRVKARVGLG